MKVQHTHNEIGERLARIDELVAQIERSVDPVTREAAREMAAGLLEFHAAGLERLVAFMNESGDDGRRLLEAMGREPTIAGLLLLHGLHPVSLEDRIAQALDSVRPFMESHGGGVELLGFNDGVVLLRLHGHCEGCTASFITLKVTIEKAILEAAPEVLKIEVEEPAVAPAPHAPPTLAAC